MLKKCCPYQGCKAIIDIQETACDKHKNYYDTNIRRAKENKKYDDFYHSLEWQYMRMNIINNFFGLDVYAYYAHNKIVKATLVHHIIEIKDDWNKRLLRLNLIPVSDMSHREIDKLYRLDKASAQSRLFEYLQRFKAEFSVQGGI